MLYCCDVTTDRLLQVLMFHEQQQGSLLLKDSCVFQWKWSLLWHSYPVFLGNYYLLLRNCLVFLQNWSLPLHKYICRELLENWYVLLHRWYVLLQDWTETGAVSSVNTNDCCGFTPRIKQMFDGCKVMLYQDCIWLLTFCRRRSWSCITLAISEIYYVVCLFMLYLPLKVHNRGIMYVHEHDWTCTTCR